MWAWASKGRMSREMVEGQSSFAINHGNRQKAEWALPFSQEGQVQSNSALAADAKLLSPLLSL